jgi:pyrimidine operon attenuation protein/uracil phosphoribosyltransferase
VGKNLPTARAEHVHVCLSEMGEGEDAVEIRKPGGGDAAGAAS